MQHHSGQPAAASIRTQTAWDSRSSRIVHTDMNAAALRLHAAAYSVRNATDAVVTWETDSVRSSGTDLRSLL